MNLSKEPAKAKLSVMIPAYNAEKWIGPTLEHLWRSLKETKWGGIEILVVDDGSTDGTAEAAKTAKIGVPVEVVRQPNSGRLKTRRNGIEKSSGDYVLMLDSRVYTQPDAFKYLVSQMRKDSQAVVWNGHIIVERRGNPFARFWYVVTFIAWRRYMRHPRLSHYGSEEFDYYPKGAGCFFAPRALLLDAYSKFSTSYEDDRFANDDTSLIRHIAEQSDIYISPGFSFTYNSRSTWKAFIRHTLHRGVVFVDGYFKPGTRYFLPLALYFLALPVFLVMVIFGPIWLLAIPVLALAALAGALILGVELADAAAFAYVLPVFSAYYSVGLYQGLLMKLAGRRLKH